MGNQFWTYLIAITLLTITPGMDTMLIIRNTTRGGWKDGAVSSLGICSGLFVHAIISAVGISLILLQSAWAFGALKLAGAGYLVWLGLVTLHRAMDKGKIHTPLTRDNRVHIQGAVSSRATCQVYDIRGQKVFETRLSDTDLNTFKISPVVSGVYLVKVTDGEKVRTEKVFFR